MADAKRANLLLIQIDYERLLLPGRDGARKKPAGMKGVAPWPTVALGAVAGAASAPLGWPMSDGVVPGVDLDTGGAA